MRPDEALGAARELRAICYATWTSKPVRARRAAGALNALAERFDHREIAGNAEWVAGIAAITRGRFDDAVDRLNSAAAIFESAGLVSEAANTQVAKLIALALPGRYDEALKAGRRALKTLIGLGDELAAGKVEMNLSNIVSRRERHRDAESYCLSALARFEKCGAREWATMALNDLANTYAELNDFRRAEEFYGRALDQARAAKMLVTEAEIEASMGTLARSRGKFDDALKALELSRQKYERLRMPHQSAIAELEIAGIYADLNLAAEAGGIFASAERRLRRLGIRADEARAAAGRGRSFLAQGELRRATAALGRAARLFSTEKIPSGAAAAILAEAEIGLARGDPGTALGLARRAETLLMRIARPREASEARRIRAEALAKLGRSRAARRLLEDVLRESTASEQPGTAVAALNSIGMIELDAGRLDLAEGRFREAAEIIESMRAPLPGEEFRMAFLADKLAPFTNLARIQIRRREFGKALEAVEMAKARTLSEIRTPLPSGSGVETELARRRNEIREDLNWFYSRPDRSDGQRTVSAIRRLEREIASLERRIAAAGRMTGGASSKRFSVESLQAALGPHRAMVEFVRFGDSYSVFTVTDADVTFAADVASESEIRELIEGLRFQFGALRYGAGATDAFGDELQSRADHYLRKLFDRLAASWAGSVAGRELYIVPAGSVNYVPVQALKRDRYLIEDHEITVSPSAALVARSIGRPFSPPRSSLLIGFGDAGIPLAESEAREIAAILPCADALTGDRATFANYCERAERFDLLHFACHGNFRPDNPMFSSLRLADGNVTVRDICAQTLKAGVVTLSACETGLSKVCPGDEILGLARGFLTAGAATLVISLWTVNDAATTGLMKSFYEELQLGSRVGASLRKAQLEFVARGAHPYFWSPFVAIGG
jgi:tetratricopeptide (TPR) repeat protein